MTSAIGIGSFLLLAGLCLLPVLLITTIVGGAIIMWNWRRRKRAEELRYLRGYQVPNPWDNRW